MGRFWHQDRGAQNSSRRLRRERKLDLDALETRQLMATSIVFPKLSPHYLYPPNGRLVTVHVSGFVASSIDNSFPKTRFVVIDEYREYEPSGIVELKQLDPNGYSYAFDIRLPAKLNKNDKDGRFFNVLVEASDSESATGKYLRVLVPGPDTPRRPRPPADDPGGIPATVETDEGPQPLSPRQLNEAKVAQAAAQPAGRLRPRRR